MLCPQYDIKKDNDTAVTEEMVSLANLLDGVRPVSLMNSDPLYICTVMYHVQVKPVIISLMILYIS